MLFIGTKILCSKVDSEENLRLGSYKKVPQEYQTRGRKKNTEGTKGLEQVPVPVSGRTLEGLVRVPESVPRPKVESLFGMGDEGGDVG